MKIAIIGGSGFVGTNLLNLLSKDQDFTTINIDINPSVVHSELTVVGDVLNQPSLEKNLAGVDAVVLLAAEHRDDVSPISLYYDVNVQGMRNVLQAMHSQGVKRIIFTSSVAIYGLDKDNPGESFPADPFNHYGKSKWQAEQVLQDWYKDHSDWSIRVVRPTVVFGEGNRGNVYNLLKQIASGRFMLIGKGNNQKSMSYIGNIAAFLRYLTTDVQPGVEIFNYVDKPDFTTKDLVRQTSAVLGKKIPTTSIPYWLGMLGGYGFDVLAFLTRRKLSISSVRVKKFCAVTKYDSTKAMNSGFKPPYTMQEGLQRTLSSEFGK
ncbi:NAD-dependent epimerase/dehydratase family protein [Sphingobacterium corticis]|uniref:NAD-dependent epimerase/dehydratase family protein n=1 Tax=Sphingobacterium corticis TaxID=1812823 RepID=A0ABW5NGT3_9SPHI